MDNDNPKTFLYCRTAEKIKEMILTEGIAVGSYLPSERKLTMQMGVAFLTVRKALELLCNEGIIKKLPSRGNMVVRLPQKIRKTRIGLTIWAEAGINHPATQHLLSLSGKHLPSSQYELVIIFIDSTMLENNDWDVLLKPDKLDGMLVTVQEIPPAIIGKLQKLDMPIVFYNFPGVTPGGWSDSFSVIDNIISYFVSLGHRDIAYITGNVLSASVRQTIEFFEKSCRNHKLPFFGDNIIRGEFSRESGYENMLKLLQSGRNWDAVLLGDDYMALGALKAVKLTGLECPGDISLACFEGCMVAEQLSPPLTAISSLQQEMLPSIKCLEMLKDIIKSGSKDSKQNFIYSPELIIRGSTGVRNK
jgi:DNA-binding LacI/PurR family transcriptional regulator